MLDSTPPSVLCQLRENYFRCAEMFLRQAIGSRLLVDKNPGLNVMVPVLVRVFPETKFLVALRDPRDVVMSCFMQGSDAYAGQFRLLDPGRDGEPVCQRDGLLAGDASTHGRSRDVCPL